MAALFVQVTGADAQTLTVRVTDAATGASLSRALVVVADGNTVLAANQITGDAWTGNVTAQNVTVIAARDLYATETRTVSFAGQPNQTITFTLRKHQPEEFNRRGRIVGFVRNTAGNPLPNATLLLIRDGRPVGAAQPKNPTGVYELQWYPPGAYSVIGSAPGHASATHTGQTIAAGESLWLDIALQPR